MPYINQQGKDRIERDGDIQSTGELTYVLTMIMIHSKERDILAHAQNAVERYLRGKTIKYYLLCNVIGSTECAILEWKRRKGNSVGVLNPPTQMNLFKHWFYDNKVAPYEEEKIKDNGDVYPKPDDFRWWEGR